jgi:hypothetical protein
MTGDQNDIIARLQRWLPTGWFPADTTTRIYSIISGFASVLAVIWMLLGYTKLQTRIATSTDGFLDLTSDDFFDGNLPRLNGETDAGFSLRIRNEILRNRLTRNAIDEQLFEITGKHPMITELQRPADVAVYGGYMSGYGVSCYASRADTYAVFITTVQPPSFGIPNVAGYGTYLAGYGTPQFPYCDPSMISGSGYTEADIYAALDRIRAAGITYWVRFAS